MQPRVPSHNSTIRLGVRWAPVGNNWYDSLQVKLTKRYSRGLELTAAYTWQKELVLGSGGNPGLAGPGSTILSAVMLKSRSHQLTAACLRHGLCLQYAAHRLALVCEMRSKTDHGGNLRYASGR
jgi:hypothetical protein